ncbi:MAG: solute-binding protein [Silicimonas sp.]|nr:solute-binding protein [Silicimonas sp.]
MNFRLIVATLATAAGLGGAALADPAPILVQSTTSTANSGLYDYLLPAFLDATGIRVNVVAVGTGQAIRNAQNCDGDLLLVHAKAAEEAFVEDGFGAWRSDLMYNDFIIVGPRDDPAGIAGQTDAPAALASIAGAGALFVSRGDDSGTHKKEMSLWQGTGVETDAASGTWYRETGSGMGATLNTGVGMGAYVLVDRATWIAFDNRQDFEIMVEGDARLFNQYGVVPVSTDACPNVNADGAAAFADWLVSDAGQARIAAFRVRGQQVFFPNAPGDRIN